MKTAHIYILALCLTTSFCQLPEPAEESELEKHPPSPDPLEIAHPPETPGHDADNSSTSNSSLQETYSYEIGSVNSSKSKIEKRASITGSVDSPSLPSIAFQIVSALLQNKLGTKGVTASALGSVFTLLNPQKIKEDLQLLRRVFNLLARLGTVVNRYLPNPAVEGSSPLDLLKTKVRFYQPQTEGDVTWVALNKTKTTVSKGTTEAAPVAPVTTTTITEVPFPAPEDDDDDDEGAEENINIEENEINFSNLNAVESSSQGTVESNPVGQISYSYGLLGRPTTTEGSTGEPTHASVATTTPPSVIRQPQPERITILENRLVDMKNDTDVQNEIPKEYGPPRGDIAPAKEYGPPRGDIPAENNEKAPGSDYTLPINVRIYGPPSNDHRQPSNERRPPSNEYGPPRNEDGPFGYDRFPSHHYGPPSDRYDRPSSNYGPPSNQYGPLSNEDRPYRPSSNDYAHPSNNYGPPSNQYGPPSNEDRPHRPSSNEYAPPRDYYGPAHRFANQQPNVAVYERLFGPNRKYANIAEIPLEKNTVYDRRQTNFRDSFGVPVRP